MAGFLSRPLVHSLYATLPSVQATMTASVHCVFAARWRECDGRGLSSRKSERWRPRASRRRDVRPQGTVHRLRRSSLGMRGGRHSAHVSANHAATRTGRVRSNMMSLPSPPPGFEYETTLRCRGWRYVRRRLPFSWPAHAARVRVGSECAVSDECRARRRRHPGSGSTTASDVVYSSSPAEQCARACVRVDRCRYVPSGGLYELTYMRGFKCRSRPDSKVSLRQLRRRVCRQAQFVRGCTRLGHRRW
ncbi:hypothetical protein OH76DRAFT_1104636 [Lentinus brumalis]|uniref:Uncharacterized protein n=1 Tax=Lentinus brumalis TaxID=2498619 RepID=A0A371CVF8_9APHY|nr:hypothetical protein OH76DRAFT_1104636 [Polyporus brumalis]